MSMKAFCCFTCTPTSSPEEAFSRMNSVYSEEEAVLNRIAEVRRQVWLSP